MYVDVKPVEVIGTDKITKRQRYIHGCDHTSVKDRHLLGKLASWLPWAVCIPGTRQMSLFVPNSSAGDIRLWYACTRL